MCCAQGPSRQRINGCCHQLLMILMTGIRTWGNCFRLIFRVLPMSDLGADRREPFAEGSESTVASGLHSCASGLHSSPNPDALEKTTLPSDSPSLSPLFPPSRTLIVYCAMAVITGIFECSKCREDARRHLPVTFYLGGGTHICA